MRNDSMALVATVQWLDNRNVNVGSWVLDNLPDDVWVQRVRLSLVGSPQAAEDWTILDASFTSAGHWEWVPDILGDDGDVPD
jgi:hypothetical protein